MNAATNVKQIQGNHTPITMLVGFVALLAIAIAVCAIASSAVASLTGFTLVAAQTPAVSLAWFGSTVAPVPGLNSWCCSAIAAGLTYLVSHK